MPKSAVLSLTLAAGLLAGCDMAGTQATMESLTWDEVSTQVTRSSEETFYELPFTRGVISVVATEDGRLRTYRLYPCAGGTAVCAGSPQGRAAQVQRTDTHFIVDGLYGHTFFLRPGGGGTLRTNGVDAPLSWNSYINGVPVWPQPIFPYTPQIRQPAGSIGP
jgi:hypothetical protein